MKYVYDTVSALKLLLLLLFFFFFLGGGGKIKKETVCSNFGLVMGGCFPACPLPQSKFLRRDPDMWRQKLTWDAVLPEDDLKRWIYWKESAAKLVDLRIPRCYKPTVDAEVTRSELHIFCDASEVAFGAAVYLKQTTADSAVSCSLVASRSRVAPLK